MGGLGLIKKCEYWIILVLFLIQGVSATSTICNSCSDCTIKLNGGYDTVILSADISNSNGTCIIFNASNILFNCNGYKIEGIKQQRKSVYGMYVANNGNITISNCLVINYTYGIELKRADYIKIINNNISHNDWGVYSQHSSNGQISDNIFQSNRLSVIYLHVAENSTIYQNNISLNGGTIWLESGINNTILSNNMFLNSGRMLLQGDEFSRILNNKLISNGRGIIIAGKNSYLRNNTLDNNSESLGFR